jgi:hypothetical protein
MREKFHSLFVGLLVLPIVVHAQFVWITNADNTITITGYTGSGGDVTIPDTIAGLPVTSIGDYAFVEAVLTSVEIPDSVTNIGSWAFAQCYDLTNVMIGNGVTSIGDYALYDCYNLASVTIGNGITRLGGQFDGAFYEYQFYDCPNLTKVYFKGNAPFTDSSVFLNDYDYIYFNWHDPVTIYYLPGTLGWSNTFDGRPTALWLPQVQTSDGSFGVKNNQFGFNIAWTSGQTVVVEACSNLANSVWQPVQTNTLTSDSVDFSDSQWANYPARFYRLRSP